MKITLYYFFFFALILFNQCNNVGNEAANNRVITDTTVNDSVLTTEYVLISPSEMFEHIFSEVPDPDPSFVNPKTNVKQYISSAQMSLNLGVYTADFIYLNYCSNKINSLDYYKVILNLAPKINIFTGIKENFPERIQKNLSNRDSLNEISKLLYYYILEDLQQDGRKKTYSLLAGGVIIESVYLAVMNVKNNEDFKPLTQNIFDQGDFLNNTYNFIASEKNDPDILSLLTKLDELKQCFNNLEVTKKDIEVQKDKGGHLSVKGGDKSKFSDADFENLKKVVTKVRHEVISNN